MIVTGIGFTIPDTEPGLQTHSWFFCLLDSHEVTPDAKIAILQLRILVTWFFIAVMPISCFLFSGVVQKSEKSHHQNGQLNQQSDQVVATSHGDALP